MSSKVGRFTLENLLGEGGGGEVYLARDPDTRSQVALKLISLDIDPELLEGERRGAELQRLIHQKVPAVAEVREVDQADGYLYIVMEYISGPALSSILIERRTLEESLAVSIAEQLCRMLEAFHGSAGAIPGLEGPMVHGDIKPENIRLTGHSRVRLLDFGLARHLADHTPAESEYGSIPYASPERLRDNALTPAADLWAVAVMLYEMVAGALPFPGRTVEDVQKRILSGRGPELLPRTVTPALAALLRQCLDPDPARRYPTAQAFRIALNSLPVQRREDTSKTRRLPKEQPTEGPAPKPMAEPEPPRSPPPALQSRKKTKSPRRHRSHWWWAAVPVILFALAELTALAGSIDVDRALESSEPKDLVHIAESFQRADLLDPFDLTRSTGRRLEKELRAAAGATIRAYREGAEVSWEQWAAAEERLALSRKIDGDEDGERAAYAFCRGQRAHLRALDHLGRGETAKARESWAEAERHFRDASTTASDWGVPMLALAAVYLDSHYGSPDPQALASALKMGEGRETRLTEDERALLASGYERLGDLEEERALRSLDEREKAAALRSARARFERALAHCRKLNSREASCVERCQQSLKRIRIRLRELGYLS